MLDLAPGRKGEVAPELKEEGEGRRGTELVITAWVAGLEWQSLEYMCPTLTTFSTPDEHMRLCLGE